MEERRKRGTIDRNIFFIMLLSLSLFSIWTAEWIEAEVLVFIPFFDLMMLILSWSSINAKQKLLRVTDYILLLFSSLLLCFLHDWCLFSSIGKLSMTALLLVEFFIHKASEKYQEARANVSINVFKQMEIRLKARLIYQEKVISNIDRLFFWHVVSLLCYLLSFFLKLVLNVYNGGRSVYVFPQWSKQIYLILILTSVWGQLQTAILEKPFRIDVVSAIVWAWMGGAFLFFRTDGGLYFDFLLIWTCSMAPYFVGLHNFIVQRCGSDKDCSVL